MWWIKKQLLRIKLYANECYHQEAESLIIWYAISFALGAAFYFSVPYELPTWLVITYLEVVLLMLYIYRNTYMKFKFLTYLLLFMLGLCVAKADAIYKSMQIENNLPQTSYLNGKIKVLDYNSNNRQRILLTNVNNFEKELKGDFKISLMGKTDWLEEGKCVEVVAKLPKSFTPNPLSNYNQERENFYKSISATGYSISPIFEKDCKTKPPFYQEIISKIRANIKNIIDKNFTPQTGAIVKAISIGDRTSITPVLNDTYRTSGLAHFLSISGMHMSIIAILIFFIIRLLLFPIGNGRYDLRKPAAIISIIATFIYFLISGQSISCIRAFVMTSLILLGVMLNRRAISLRLWSFALFIVVILTPNAVVSPGFIMSFSATLGLISYYEQNSSKIHNWLDRQSLLSKISTYLLGVIITDLVASLMTLPYSLYYFNQIAVYTTLGNMLAGPIIALWVMPALLLFLITIPFGGSKLVNNLLEYAVNTINNITSYVSNLPGAKIGENITPLTDMGIFILTLGLLWLCIWQQKWRIWGILGIILGLSTILINPTPDFVFDKDGATYAYRNKQGNLVASMWHKNNFLEKMWTKNNIKGKYTPHSKDDIKCQEVSCIYKNRIKFGQGFVMLDDKNINLKDGGYINLQTGVHYFQKENNRIWNKL